MTKKRSGGWTSIISALLFLVVLVVLVVSTTQLSGTADEEGIAATREAIERAAVLCYATEGYYPPGLDYIKQNYGVQIDESRYVVDYTIYAYNIRPVITVVGR